MSIKTGYSKKELNMVNSKINKNKKKHTTPAAQMGKKSAYWNFFGLYIKTKRLEAGLTLDIVSNYIESSKEVLHAYENGERAIPLNKIYALSNCLGISPDEITKYVSEYPEFKREI